jgi:hypothetical protein
MSWQKLMCQVMQNHGKFSCSILMMFREADPRSLPVYGENHGELQVVIN